MTMDHRENYWKLAESERGFNESQGGIRGLASAWLLGAIGAIGVLLRSETEAHWLIERSTLVVVVCALATGGLTTLWVLDQLVFHRLLNAVFIVGLKMEFDDCGLPPIRSMMMMSAEGKGMHRWQRFFYLVPMLAFLLVSILVTASSLESAATAGATWMHSLNWLLVAVQLSTIAWVVAKQQVIAFADRAAFFDDAAFADVVREEAYPSVIRRYREELKRS